MGGAGDREDYRIIRYEEEEKKDYLKIRLGEKEDREDYSEDQRRRGGQGRLFRRSEKERRTGKTIQKIRVGEEDMNDYQMIR